MSTFLYDWLPLVFVFFFYGGFILYFVSFPFGCESFKYLPFCYIFREAVKKLQSYLKQANGFLMALLSQLCFTGQDPPEPEAVKHIFGYVIQRVERPTVRTRYLTLREDQIDPTPVLRSFILYLLLQHR